ncbi:hypothetical protein NOR_03325 [Metarhizium rileyi]|uniref:Lipase, class 2 n=1 Tax=Metarhizium rileyi (strain RCEF 4871) TaxID=1649241 RepID=A0A167FNR6_METRR|nr:hypothetical protein NOR_03325 [Metarhizium rileyi RCEF 4871]
MHFTLFLALAVAAITSAAPFTTSSDTSQNEASCKSAHNPVVLLHGAGANKFEDLNLLEAWLRTRGFCTFSLTYGAYDAFPFLGGVKPVNESAADIAAFVKHVGKTTGSAKVDIVGHSEGAFQSLYVTKFGGITDLVDVVVAIAPPTHGTTFDGLTKVAETFGLDAGFRDALRTIRFEAGRDLIVGGAAVQRLNDGSPIVQKGTTVTVITSRYDELVTPQTTAFVYEPAVNNIWVQDYCPFDLVGHVGEAYDMNVWNLVLNSLEKQVGRSFTCLPGLPVK